MSDKRRAEFCATHHHACDCREFAHAQEVEQLRNRISGLIALTKTDGAELRELCAARDEARRERDSLQARIDGAKVLVATRNGVIRTDTDAFVSGKRVALVPLD